MLSAKALVNFTLLAILVPRIIRASMSSKAVHGSEIRLNYLGAEASIAISVIGVFCVALAFRFWMMMTGKQTDHTLILTRGLTLGSSHHLCVGLGTPSVYNVAGKIAANRPCRLGYTGLQHCNAYQDTRVFGRRPFDDGTLGAGDKAWWSGVRFALLRICCKST